MLERPCEVRSMHSCGTRQLVDPNIGFARQTFARPDQPRRRRAVKMLAFDARHEITDAFVGVRLARSALSENPAQQRALRSGQIAVIPAVRSGRDGVVHVDGQDQCSLRPELHVVRDLVGTHSQRRRKADLVARPTHFAHSAGDDDRDMGPLVRMSSLPQTRWIEREAGARPCCGERQTPSGCRSCSGQLPSSSACSLSARASTFNASSAPSVTKACPPPARRPNSSSSASGRLIDSWMTLAIGRAPIFGS
jgi:hypothetical protein